MGTIPNTLCGVSYSVLTEILKEDLLLSSFYIYIWKLEIKETKYKALDFVRVTELLGEAAGFELKQTPDCCKKWTETC